MTGTPVEGTFRTDPLPADLRAVAFRSTGSPSGPLVLLHLFSPYGFRGYAVIDSEGEVVWC